MGAVCVCALLCIVHVGLCVFVCGRPMEVGPCIVVGEGVGVGLDGEEEILTVVVKI